MLNDIGYLFRFFFYVGSSLFIIYLWLFAGHDEHTTYDHRQAIPRLIAENPNDTSVILSFVEASGENLRYASDDLKNYKQIALEAVRSDGSGFEYLSDRLKNDEEIIVEAIKNYSGYFIERDIFIHIPSDILNNTLFFIKISPYLNYTSYDQKNVFELLSTEFIISLRNDIIISSFILEVESAILSAYIERVDPYSDYYHYPNTPYDTSRIDSMRKGLLAFNPPIFEKGFYKSGALHDETPYKDGKEEGVGKTYYESGALHYETPYTDGNAEGVAKSYYENGALEAEVLYKNGKEEGIEKWYYKSGALESETPNKDGKAEGVEKTYYESGALHYERIFKDDEMISRKCYDEESNEIPCD